MQANYSKIKSAGLGLAAISYDSPDVLRTFAQRKNIQFPLLSDTGSEIIRRFGILNTEVKPDSATYGIPYPGIYVLDAKANVTAKYFEDDYRERDTAAVILMQQFGIAPEEHTITTKAKHVQLTTSISDQQASMGQHLSLLLDVKLPDRVHVYAPGVQGYIPITLKLDDSSALKVTPAKYPQSKILLLKAIGESVPVYEGEFQLESEIALGNDKAVAPTLDASGDLTISGTFRYQACDDQKCYIPETVPVKWKVHFNTIDRERVPIPLQRKQP